jgi:hypothetical protein
MHSLIVDGANIVKYKSRDGELHDITSPFCGPDRPLRADKLLPRDFLYYGGTVIDDAHLELHFIKLRDKDIEHRSWTIDNNGVYVGQREIVLCLKNGARVTHELEFMTDIVAFTRVARQFLNDLQIYFLMGRVLGMHSEARSYIDSLAPDSCSELSNTQTESGQRKVHLLLVYNHCYARNISRLDFLYRHRFSEIYHILPNVAPSHPRCIAFPYGSYQYHLAVIRGLVEVRQQACPKDWVLVLQDDVLLHPRVNQFFLLDSVMTDDLSSSYYHELIINHTPTDNWYWNSRIANSCYMQSDGNLGNGFEGPSLLCDDNGFSRGIGDIFALKVGLINRFVEVLGLFASSNTFPEVAIPTSLRLLRDSTGMPVSMLPGCYLWGADRDQIRSDEWIKENFLNSDNLFLHPVKISRAKELLDLFREF